MALQELKEAITDLGKTVNEFKAENDQRLSDLEKKGGADPLLAEKVDRINERITELAALKERLEDLETKAAREGGLGGFTNELEQAKAQHKKAFNDFMRKGSEAGLRDLEVKAALTTQSDPDGGFLVGSETDSAIDHIEADYSAMRDLARIVKLSSAEFKKVVNVGGATSGWVGEEDGRPETNTPQLKELKFPGMEVYANPKATKGMLDDASFDVEAWLAEEIGIEFAEQEGAAFITGNGVTQPRGLLSYDAVANASYSFGKLGYIASGAAGAFAASNPSDKLIDIQHALKRGYRKNGVWLMNDLTFADIRKFKDGNGDYLWKAGLEEGASTTLLGKPVETDDFMPDIAANSLSIAFGDFRRGYVIVDRMGVRVLRDPYTAKPYIQFYTTKRVGGGIQNFEAIKLMKFSTS